MARICAFVFNPAIRDARVVKQAESLAAQGHEVTIIGLADNNFPEERAELASGVEILRVPREVGRPGLFARLSQIPRKMVQKGLHLLVLPFLLIYVAVYGLEGPLEQRAGRVLDLVIYTALAFGVFHLLANLGRLVEAVRFLAGFGLKLFVGKERSEAAFHMLTATARRVMPKLFEGEVGRRMNRRIDHMVKMARELNPDLVHCHDVHTLPAGAAMKKLTGCKVVYDAHEIYEEIAQGNPASAQRYREIHFKHLHSLDGFVTINDSIAEWYRENYPRVPAPTVVMNATLRTPEFEYDGRLHEAAGVKANKKILLYQGGFATKRGLEYLVQSAAHLPKEWTLVMMGWGRLEPTLRVMGDTINASLADTRGEAAVLFLPPVPQNELPYWSAGGTIGVIPYEKVGLNHWFCTPNKLWEYPNAGVPVLVSPFPELRKPVESYGYGWLLPEEQDPRKLAELVASLSDSEIARAREACKTFSDVENWSKYEVRLLELYDSLLDGAKAAPALAPAESSNGRVAAE